VTVRVGDTNFPAGPGSGGSTTAPSIGPAAREAGLRAREAVAEAVAKEWGLKPEEVRLEGGQVKGPAGKAAPFEKACSVLPAEGVRVFGKRRPNYASFTDTTGGCQFVAPFSTQRNTCRATVTILRGQPRNVSRATKLT
jgi:xanthine dehydrogenase YagR molybdenum-binding subunit